MSPSRRALLTGTLAGAAAVGLGRAIPSQAQSQAEAQSLPASHDAALHAARRLSFGATPELVAKVRSVGLAAWLEDQLASGPDVAAEAAVVGPGSAPLPYAALTQLRAAGRNPVRELQGATFARAVWGDRQLYEVLVEVWTNHLSIASDVPGVDDHKVVDDRDVIRAHALGNFSDMLVASVQSPAMLRYLSNANSRGKKPNENYARELLELHTVGVHGGYQQRDVRDAALALTGLTVDNDTGRFLFRPEWHATGPVRVLGWSHPNADASKGLDVALSLARYLAVHPATAQAIATKLVRRFVADNPPAGLVASAAKVYLAGGTAIPPVVRHIVLSADFARSSGTKAQRPYEWFSAAARALKLQQSPGHLDAVVFELGRLAQVPFGWRLPDGYPDNAQDWASTASMLARWNTAQSLVAGGIATFDKLDVDALVGSPVPTTAGALADRLVTTMLGVPARAALRSALLRPSGLDASAAVDQARVRQLAGPMAALVLSSPEAQVR
ncbi:MAG: DUF1800 domain-containing protein [Mycobacteriales bacterium]